MNNGVNKYCVHEIITQSAKGCMANNVRIEPSEKCVGESGAQWDKMTKFMPNN